MVNKKDIDRLVNFINEEIKTKLGEKLDSIYLIGSYTQGKITTSRPDINWLLIHKDPIEDNSRWILGEILTKTIDAFIKVFTVRSEPRPFKFSYPIKRGEDVFVYISIVVNATLSDVFKIKNSFIPEYVFEGFKSSRKLVYGEDVLKNINFNISKKEILSSAMAKILSHKVQLDRIPLAYHLERDIDLVFNESLSHGKNLIYFGIELIMTDNELKEKKFLEYFHNETKLISIYKDRFPRVLKFVSNIIKAKSNYQEWKRIKEKAKAIYFDSSALCNSLFYAFLNKEFNDN